MISFKRILRTSSASTSQPTDPTVTTKPLRVDKVCKTKSGFSIYGLTSIFVGAFWPVIGTTYSDHLPPSRLPRPCLC
jgi:hypothetical protein